MLTWCRQFGKAGSSYDYNSVDIAQCKEKARELEELQKGMKKKVNPKVLNMIDTWVLPLFDCVFPIYNPISRVEKKEAELKKNLQTVLRDKTKIEETIEQLDVLKLEALENTWTKVSK